MATIFSKMSKNQKIITVIITVIGISSFTIFSYYSVGSPTTILIIIVMIVVIALLTINQYKPKISSGTEKTKPSSGTEKIPRRGWTVVEKEIVRNRQGGKCNICRKIPPRWRYDHKDGDRSNNSLRNCQGLCPNCDDVKTYDED